jgi:hypothetical protein
MLRYRGDRLGQLTIKVVLSKLGCDSHDRVPRLSQNSGSEEGVAIKSPLLPRAVDGVKALAIHKDQYRLLGSPLPHEDAIKGRSPGDVPIPKYHHAGHALNPIHNPLLKGRPQEHIGPIPQLPD